MIGFWACVDDPTVQMRLKKATNTFTFFIIKNIFSMAKNSLKSG
jgi:hypothetical protein